MTGQDLHERAAVQAVLFDYGLVLTGPPNPVAWEEMLAILGSDNDRFHAAYWRSRHDYDRGVLSGPAYWGVVAADLHRRVGAAQLDLLLHADVALWTQENAPMIDWAAALQRAGIRTGILSNLGDAMETGVMSTFAWMSAFTHHTFSHRLGIAKPEAAIYRHAADGLGVPANTVLFLDDRSDNVEAAIAVGMQAIQYRNHAEFLQEFRDRGYQRELPQPE